ncbi:MAG: alpha/beta hydrolase [Oscillospiraceae bacterium]|nr:alpha/beta hydrolase [Oscillospiraceae bacterium]
MDMPKLDTPWKLTKPDPNVPGSQGEVDVSGITRKWLDVPYASQSPSQKLDIFLPEEGEGPFPVLIFMHGGAYLFGTKRDMQFLHAVDGVTKGYAVVTVEQRLAFEAQFPYGLFDLKAAIRFLRANAGKYSLDPDRFALSGDSAGAYYAVMCAATQDIPGYEDFTMGNPDVSSKVQAVVGWYGCYHLMEMLPPEPDPDNPPPPPPADMPPMPDLYQFLVGAKPRAIHGLMYFTNPLNFVTPAFPPILIQAGTGDQVVPHNQSIMLHEKIRAVCGEGRSTLQLMEGWNHGGFSFGWYEPKHQTEVYRFLDRILK